MTDNNIQLIYKHDETLILVLKYIVYMYMSQKLIFMITIRYICQVLTTTLVYLPHFSNRYPLPL